MCVCWHLCVCVKICVCVDWFVWLLLACHLFLCVAWLGFALLGLDLSCCVLACLVWVLFFRAALLCVYSFVSLSAHWSVCLSVCLLACFFACCESASACLLCDLPLPAGYLSVCLRLSVSLSLHISLSLSLSLSLPLSTLGVLGVAPFWSRSLVCLRRSVGLCLATATLSHGHLSPCPKIRGP